MKLFSTPRSAVLSTLAIVLIVVGFSGLVVGQVLAASLGGPWQHGGNGWSRDALPPEIAGLADVPDAQKFDHFRGVQLTLTDRDNKPLLVNVTPGLVTSVSPSSVTINGNDGSSHTYALDARTIQHDQTVKQNDKVVVATVNNSSTATALFSLQGDGHGPGGRWGR